VRTADDAVAFIERLKGDALFQSRLAGAANPAERLVIAREEGFDLSRDDIATVRRTLGVQELSEADLERVAGGVGSTTIVTAAGSTSMVTIAAGAAAFL
jgi:predicted ribosomally synthesized peptide with nif11-like leader